MKRILAVLGAVTMATVGALALASPANATPTADCKTVTSNITDRVDSAVGGYNWAKDTFKRSLKICADASVSSLAKTEAWKYTAEAVDEGTFVTNGLKSPQNASVAMKPGVKGGFAGGFKATLTGPANFAGLKADGDTNINTKSSSEWLPFVFPDSKSELTSWGWKYTLCNESWQNKMGGNVGNITGLDKHACFNVVFTDKCDGSTVVTLENQATTDLSEAKYKVSGHEGLVVVKGGNKIDVTVKNADKKVLVDALQMRGKGHTWTLPKDCATPGAPGTTLPAGTNTSNSLPLTGPPIGLITITGFVLIGGGAFMLYKLRRKREVFTAE